MCNFFATFSNSSIGYFFIYLSYLSMGGDLAIEVFALSASTVPREWCI